MKIIIISDIHDNLVNLEKCLNWAKKNKFKALICCGDLTNSETLKSLAANFDGSIHIINGNGEIYIEKEVKLYNNIIHYGKVGRIEFDKKTIGFCHEPYLIDRVRDLGECDIVFYGHTHKPWIEKRGSIDIVNPGTLGGMLSDGTFAILDTETGNLELKLLEKL